MNKNVIFAHQEKYIKFLESEVYRLNDQILRMKDEQKEDPLDISEMYMKCSSPPLNMSVHPTIPLQATIECKPENDIYVRSVILLRYGNYRQALYFDDILKDNIEVFGYLFERFFQEFMENKVRSVKLGKLLSEIKE